MATLVISYVSRTIASYAQTFRLLFNARQHASERGIVLLFRSVRHYGIVSEMHKA